MRVLNLNLWTVAGNILGSDLPREYEFIQALLVVLLICLFIFILLSPLLILKNIMGGN